MYHCRPLVAEPAYAFRAVLLKVERKRGSVRGPRDVSSANSHEIVLGMGRVVSRHARSQELRLHLTLTARGISTPYSF